MGTIPTPPTFVAGAVLTAAGLNSLRDVLNFWAGPPQCFAYQSSVQSITTGTGYTLMPLQAERFDIVQSGDSPMHDNVTQNSRVVFRTAGKYQISAQCSFASAGGSRRAVDLRMNAAGSSAGGTRVGFSQQSPLSGFTTAVPVTPFTITAAAGDYIEMFGSQDSGGTINSVASDVDTFIYARLIST